MDYKINDEEHNQPSSDSTQLGNSTQVLHRSALTSALPATSNVFNRFCGVNDTSLCDVLQAPISCSLPANTLKSEFKATALHVDETRNVKRSGIIPISSRCRYYSCSHDADKESESSIDHNDQLRSSMSEDIFFMSDEESSTSGDEENRASASTNERSSSAAHEPTSTSGNPRYYSDESTMTSKSAASATNTFTATQLVKQNIHQFSASRHAQYELTACRFHWPNYEAELKATQEYLSKPPDFSISRF